MKKAFTKAIAFLASISLAVLGTAYTNKEQPFTAQAIGKQAIKITVCNYSYNQGWISYFDVQCVEANFGKHKGYNYSWITHSWGVPQNKCEPYFNPYNVHPQMIYDVPKSLLDDWFIKGSIYIK